MGNLIMKIIIKLNIVRILHQIATHLVISTPDRQLHLQK